MSGRWLRIIDALGSRDTNAGDEPKSNNQVDLLAVKGRGRNEQTVANGSNSSAAGRRHQTERARSQEPETAEVRVMAAGIPTIQ